MAITVRFKGDAHRYFDVVHTILENRQLSICRFPVLFDREVRDGKEVFKEGHNMTTVEIVANEELDISVLMEKTFYDINTRYPQSESVIDVEHVSIKQ